MGEMHGIGMQDGRELAVVFEQRNPAPSDAVDGRASPVNLTAELQLPIRNEPLHAPVETVS